MKCEIAKILKGFLLTLNIYCIQYTVYTVYIAYIQYINNFRFVYNEMEKYFKKLNFLNQFLYLSIQICYILKFYTIYGFQLELITEKIEFSIYYSKTHIFKKEISLPFIMKYINFFQKTNILLKKGIGKVINNIIIMFNERVQKSNAFSKRTSVKKKFCSHTFYTSTRNRLVKHTQIIYVLENYLSKLLQAELKKKHGI